MGRRPAELRVLVSIVRVAGRALGSRVVSKVTTGRFFEDFRIGEQLVHAVPRTLHGGDISTYISLTGDRHPLSASTEVARSLGFQREVMPDLLVFHIVFGKSVPDISHNATANLGYADVRFLRPVYPGDTLIAASEVIGLREVSSGEAGVSAASRLHGRLK